MVPKSVFVGILATALLGWSSLSMADEYRADEFLTLDLVKAVLSPKRLGPASEFEPVAVVARTDPGGERAPARVVRVERVTQPKTHIEAHVATHVVTHVAQMRAAKPRGAVRTRLAHRHGNPLDAQARDTRIQVWPCKSGGICDWQRAKN